MGAKLENPLKQKQCLCYLKMNLSMKFKIRYGFLDISFIFAPVNMYKS
jgi:hypothetical protein